MATLAPMPDEIDLKRMHWTSSTVDARLRETFIDSEGVARAAVLLSGLMGEDPNDPTGTDEAVCRLMLAAIRMSEGNLFKLAAWIEVAHRDPRDLIVAAEYTRELQDGDLHARGIDLAEYLAWVGGPRH